MTKDERRFIRREAINHCLHQRYIGRSKMTGHSTITFFVRLWERQVYGYELVVYSQDVTSK